MPGINMSKCGSEKSCLGVPKAASVCLGITAGCLAAWSRRCRLGKEDPQAKSLQQTSAQNKPNLKLFHKITLFSSARNGLHSAVL
jgi:hypothetical protein